MIYGLYEFADNGVLAKLTTPVTYDDNGNVIPLSQRFNKNKDDIRYAIVGEKGVRNLKDAQDATRNLDVAREMEQAGKDAKAIYLATGWERGTDGLWRYEIPDVQMADKWHLARTLGELVDGEELFAAYPEMRETPVSYARNVSWGGVVQEGRIKLNLDKSDDIDAFRRIVIHEIQHLIPHEEGFAQGGSTQNMTEAILRSEFRDADDYFDATDTLENLKAQSHNIFVYGRLDTARRDKVVSMLRKFISDDRLVQYAPKTASKLIPVVKKFLAIDDVAFKSGDEIDALVEDIRKAFLPGRTEINQFIKKHKSHKAISKRSNEIKKLGAYTVYESLAGEVEARNVQKRANMTAEERRATPFSETEDVARDNQLIINIANEASERHSVTADEVLKAAEAEREAWAREEDGRLVGYERWSIGAARKEQMRQGLKTKLTYASDEQVEKTISEIEAMGERSKKGGNPKLEKIAFHWAKEGTIILPEDEYKVVDAIRVAEKAKVDPMQYKSPMELINAHSDIKLKEKPIDPDTVPELSNKQDMGDGVVVYDVEDSKEGQLAVRKILNTHRGVDCSPWCLLQGDGKGGLSVHAWKYWNTYNGFDKRIAFKNGKVIAFNADETPLYDDSIQEENGYRYANDSYTDRRIYESEEGAIDYAEQTILEMHGEYGLLNVGFSSDEYKKFYSCEELIEILKLTDNVWSFVDVLNDDISNELPSELIEKLKDANRKSNIDEVLDESEIGELISSLNSIKDAIIEAWDEWVDGAHSVSVQDGKVYIIDDAGNRNNVAIVDPSIFKGGGYGGRWWDMNDAPYESLEELIDSKNERFSIDSTRPWKDDFPKITIHTTLPNVKKKYGDLHARAKAGDRDAAFDLVQAIINPKKIDELKQRHPEAQYVVAVHAEEVTGRNQLPIYFARFVADGMGIAVNDNIVQSVRANHTGADALERLTRRAQFSGNVEKGAKYILVDDHVTAGGTLNELRHYIENNGGEVVEIMCLTASKGSTIIALQTETLKRLVEKFGHEELTQYLRDAGIAGDIRAITESEGQYLLKLSPDTLRDRGLEERRERDSGAFSNENGATQSATSAEVNLGTPPVPASIADVSDGGRESIVGEKIRTTEPVREYGNDSHFVAAIILDKASGVKSEKRKGTYDRIHDIFGAEITTDEAERIAEADWEGFQEALGALLFDFNQSYGFVLDEKNEWIQLGRAIDWDSIALKQSDSSANQSAHAESDSSVPA